jgi:hypothetical protein
MSIQWNVNGAIYGEQLYAALCRLGSSHCSLRIESEVFHLIYRNAGRKPKSGGIGFVYQKQFEGYNCSSFELKIFFLLWGL